MPAPGWRGLCNATRRFCAETSAMLEQGLGKGHGCEAMKAPLGLSSGSAVCDSRWRGCLLYTSNRKISWLFCFSGRVCTLLHISCTLYKKAMNSLHRLHSVYFAAQKLSLSGRGPSILLRKTVLSLKSPTGAFIVPLRSTNANCLLLRLRRNKQHDCHKNI